MPNSNYRMEGENWTNPVRVCPTPDKSRTQMNFWYYNYRAHVSDRSPITLARIVSARYESCADVLDGHAYHDGLKLTSGIYGSTFYLLTGFHGFHVTIGVIMLTVILYRIQKGHFNLENHFAFEGVAWYWHFVDVVWLGLFIFVYWI